MLQFANAVGVIRAALYATAATRKCLLREVAQPPYHEAELVDARPVPLFASIRCVHQLRVGVSLRKKKKNCFPAVRRARTLRNDTCE